MRASICLFIAALVSSGCPSNKTVPSASYAPATTLRPASTRCQGRTCSCRPLDSNDEQEEEKITAGHKRFEFRLPRTPTALWVSIAGEGVYYKDAKNVDPQCFYVDLKPGFHRVTIHGEKRDAEVGLQVGLTIYEHAIPIEGRGAEWYRSFHLACGMGASKCTKDELTEWAKHQRTLTRGVLDPCGSVMVKASTFGGVREVKGDEDYRELTVRFGLKVYEFKPYRRPGDPRCTGPIKNK